MTKRATMCAADGKAGGLEPPSPLELSQSHHDSQMLFMELQDLTPSLVGFGLGPVILFYVQVFPFQVRTFTLYIVC